VRPLCTFAGFPNQVIATAIHAGHELRPEIAASTALDDATRMREEDPFTDRLTAIGTAAVVAHRSRFEVDLNRPREQAVYRGPDDAWGLDLWVRPLSDREIEESLVLYDDFYRELEHRLDDVAARGPFVVLDLHSYNHRRDGAEAPAEAPAENPEINVGTGSLDRDCWSAVVDAFISAIPDRDVRENVRFRGGELSRWVNTRYRDRGCALAIEFKKTFMDEWTSALDTDHLEELRQNLAATLPALTTTPSCASS
jgi:N-formylglutamate deformylase